MYLSTSFRARSFISNTCGRDASFAPPGEFYRNRRGGLGFRQLSRVDRCSVGHGFRDAAQRYIFGVLRFADYGIGVRQFAGNGRDGALGSTKTYVSVWQYTALYPKTPAGLLHCYLAALPFFRNSLVGDLCYVGLIFGSLEAFRAWRRVKQKRFSLVRASGVAPTTTIGSSTVVGKSDFLV